MCNKFCSSFRGDIHPRNVKPSFSGVVAFLSVLTVLFLLPVTGLAQNFSKTAGALQPLGMQYFTNQYLANPAMAGLDTGLHISTAYRAQFNESPGSPVTKSAAADYYVGNRVGAGINIFNDEAGLINRTRVALTYAYHLPVNDRGDRLNFGISAGFNNERLDRSAIVGNEDDPSIGLYNRREAFFEGDFGVAYTSEKFTLQASVPNIMNTFRKEENRTIDGAIFYAALSYKLPVSEEVMIEPKACFRGVRGYDNLFDFGANATFFNNLFNVFGMYHTSKNYTLGAGLSYKNTLGVHAMYTSQTSGLKNYTDGMFELGLTLNLFK